MAQFSYPWPGIAPENGVDAGPYTSDQWTAAWGTFMRGGVVVDSDTGLRTDSALASVGIFYCVGNALEVTNPGAAANTVQIDTGAAIVDGQFFKNDAAVTFTIPSSKAYDIIVLRKNYTASEFEPFDSVDADEIVPAYSTRITRLDIAGGDVFTQDTTQATYWDIYIAYVSTDAAGAVTIDDEREFVDAENKGSFTDVTSGLNVTDASVLYVDAKNDMPPGGAIFLPGDSGHAGKVAFASGRFSVPADYISDLTLTAIVSTEKGEPSGNMYCQTTATHNYYGSSLVGTTLSNTYASYSLTSSSAFGYKLNWISELAITSIGPPSMRPGDIITVKTERDSTNVLDTIGGDLLVLGWRITYFGWK